MMSSLLYVSGAIAMDFEEKRQSLWLAKQGADALVLVNNVNVDIGSMELNGKKGVARKAWARSEVQAIWDIPIKIENGPFFFSVTTAGKRYTWAIKAFKPYNLELGLIEYKTDLGSKIMLKQITEKGGSKDDLRSKVVPMLEEKPHQ